MITAKVALHGRELGDVKVLNPGGWFGKTWLVELGGSYWPLFLIVEADSITDAIDELAESRFGDQITVSEDDLRRFPDDYPEDDRQYSASGKVLDTDHLMIYGDEQFGFPCRYFGHGLPADGIDPKTINPDGTYGEDGIEVGD